MTAIRRRLICTRSDLRFTQCDQIGGFELAVLKDHDDVDAVVFWELPFEKYEFISVGGGSVEEASAI